MDRTRTNIDWWSSSHQAPTLPWKAPPSARLTQAPLFCTRIPWHLHNFCICHMKHHSLPPTCLLPLPYLHMLFFPPTSLIIPPIIPVSHPLHTGHYQQEAKLQDFTALPPTPTTLLVISPPRPPTIQLHTIFLQPFSTYLAWAQELLNLILV